MKRILPFAILFLLAAPFSRAQEANLNHVEIGVFAHYFRFSPTDANFLGAGARLGVNFTKNVQIEVEGSYDLTACLRNASQTLPAQSRQVARTSAIFSGLTSSVAGLRDNNVRGVLYPGGGIEGFLGPVGLRLEADDEIYFLSGAHNNLVVSFGPSIRF